MSKELETAEQGYEKEQKAKGNSNEDWIDRLARLVIPILILIAIVKISCLQSSSREIQNSLQEIGENIPAPNNYPDQDGYSASADDSDQDYFKPLGVLYIMEDGKQYLHYMHEKEFVQWQEEKGDLASQNSKTLPASRRIKKTIVVRSWEVIHNVVIGKERSNLCITVSLAGIAVPASIIFIQKMEEKTMARHPYEFLFVDSAAEERYCLERWVDDEVQDLAIGPDGKNCQTSRFLRKP